MKTFFLAMLCLCSTSLFAAAIYDGECVVAPVAKTTNNLETLAQKYVSMAAGESLVIYSDAKAVYKVSVYDLQGTPTPMHNLELDILKPGPLTRESVLASGSVSFTSEMPASFTVYGQGQTLLACSRLIH